MPRTVFQKAVFGLLMVVFMVLAMECYNQGMLSGGLTWQGVKKALDEMKIMVPVCFVMSFFIADPIASRITMRNAGSGCDSRLVMIAFRASVTVSMMCPIMSFWATLFFRKPGVSEFIPAWLSTVVMNYPMAFFWQLMFCGPLVRFLFRLLFRERT